MLGAALVTDGGDRLGTAVVGLTLPWFVGEAPDEVLGVELGTLSGATLGSGLFPWVGMLVGCAVVGRTLGNVDGGPVGAAAGLLVREALDSPVERALGGALGCPAGGTDVGGP